MAVSTRIFEYVQEIHLKIGKHLEEIYRCDTGDARILQEETINKYLRLLLKKVAPDAATDINHGLAYPDIKLSTEGVVANIIASMSRFKQYQVPPIQLEDLSRDSEENRDFSRSTVQNFVSSYIHPDTPYKGLLLWHGVGVGKTCGAISISENFLNLMGRDARPTLIVTPSRALHDTWRKEIFNMQKQLSQEEYNAYLENMGTLSFSQWIRASKEERLAAPLREHGEASPAPIYSLQCTGHKYVPPMIVDKRSLRTEGGPEGPEGEEGSEEVGVDAKTMSREEKRRIYHRRLRERAANQHIDNAYTFSSYALLASGYLKHEQALRTRGYSGVEGRMVKYIIRTFSNRVIILDEVHRVKERDSKAASAPSHYVAGTEVFVRVSKGTKEEKQTKMKKSRVRRAWIVKYLEATESSPPQYIVELQYKQMPKDSGPQVHISVDDVEWAQQESMMDLKMKVLKLIARYAINTKILLLSATPMYTRPHEIVDLLDLLHLNDGRPPLDKSRIFGPRGLLDDGDTGVHAKKLLLDASQGYVSYVRGENPRSFPLQLEPGVEKAELGRGYQYQPEPCLSFVSADSSSLVRKLLEPTEWIQDFPLYASEMGEYQWKCWLAICQNGVGSNRPWSFSGLLENKSPTHASIVTYPLLNDEELEDLTESLNLYDESEAALDTVEERLDPGLKTKLAKCFGMAGFKATYNAGLKEFTKGVTNQEWLDLDPEEGERGLGDYSSKMAEILRLANKSRGIVFVYSEYVGIGVDTLALALERNGYRHFDEGQVWDPVTRRWTGGNAPDMLRDGHRGKSLALHGRPDAEEADKRQARYILLKGDVSDSQMARYIGEVRGERGGSNVYGEKIKIVLGSKKVREGFSLKCVRQIHILDPWYHLNAIDQSIGRGIRNKSHELLPPEERNVTSFLHVARLPRLDEDAYEDWASYLNNIIPDDLRPPTSEDYPLSLLESSDEYIYRKAIEETRAIAKVERVLQTNAVDCTLQKEANMYPRAVLQERGVVLTRIVNSQGDVLEGAPLGDVDRSWKCKFEECVYSCLPGAVEEIKEIKEIHPTSYGYVSKAKLQEMTQWIRQLFKRKHAYTLDELIHELSSSESSRDMLEALHHLLRSREPIYDKYFRKGYLIYRRKMYGDVSYYIFQPEWTSIINQDSLNQQDEDISEILRSTIPPQTRLLEQVEVVELPEEEDIGVQEPIQERLKAEYLNHCLYLLDRQQFPFAFGLEDKGNPPCPGKEGVKHGKRPPVPNIRHILMMGAFCVLDRIWKAGEELEFLKWLCERAAQRIITPIQLERDNEVEILNAYEKSAEWQELVATGRQGEAKYRPTYFFEAPGCPEVISVHTRLNEGIAPTLEECACHFYFGGLPEELGATCPARDSPERYSVYLKETVIGDASYHLPAHARCIEPVEGTPQYKQVVYRIDYEKGQEGEQEGAQNLVVQFTPLEEGLGYLIGDKYITWDGKYLSENESGDGNTKQKQQEYVREIRQGDVKPSALNNNYNLGALHRHIDCAYLVNRQKLKRRAPGSSVANMPSGVILNNLSMGKIVKAGIFDVKPKLQVIDKALNKGLDSKRLRVMMILYIYFLDYIGWQQDKQPSRIRYLKYGVSRYFETRGKADKSKKK